MLFFQTRLSPLFYSIWKVTWWIKVSLPIMWFLLCDLRELSIQVIKCEILNCINVIETSFLFWQTDYFPFYNVVKIIAWIVFFHYTEHRITIFLIKWKNINCIYNLGYVVTRWYKCVFYHDLLRIQKKTFFSFLQSKLNRVIRFRWNFCFLFPTFPEFLFPTRW